MPSFLKWLEQQAPPEDKTETSPVAKRAANLVSPQIASVPVKEPLETAALVSDPQPLTTAQLARRRSLMAVIGALVLLALAATIGAVFWLVGQL
jgi:hypothetical protein